MTNGPDDKDLREQASRQSSHAGQSGQVGQPEQTGQQSPYQPWPEPQREGQVPPGDWNSPGYTEFVEERGLVGFRVVAKIIDYIVLSIATSIVITPLYLAWIFGRIDRFEELSEQNDPEVFPWEFFAEFFAVWGLMMFLTLLISVLYYFISEHKFGQTLGKKAFELKVQTVHGQRASGGQLLARAILYTFSMMLYFWVIELIVSLVSSDNRSITDRIVGTKVVRFKKVYHYPPAGPPSY